MDSFNKLSDSVYDVFTCVTVQLKHDREAIMFKVKSSVMSASLHKHLDDIRIDDLVTLTFNLIKKIYGVSSLFDVVVKSVSKETQNT